METRAKQTASWVRMLGSAQALKRIRNGRMRRIPRQVYPRMLEREYTKAMVRLISDVEGAFIDLKRELPGLLESAAREARIDSAGVRLDAGEGKRVRQLIEAARKRMNESVLTPQLEKLAEDFAQRTSSAQRIQLGKQVHAALGVDLFGGDARMRPLMEAFVDSNVGLIRKLSDEVAGRVETRVLAAVQDAKPWSDFADELQDQFGFAEHRAKIIARDQIGKFYGQANAARQRELGITKFVWRTSGDERVREEHEALNGQVFSYDEPPSEGLPGEPILCRCSAEPLFDDIAGLVAA
jgi:SPP1 gp7 family putative phage head morphogenesis protein